MLALVQSLLRPDHSLLRHPVSALAAGPSGWLQNVNFLLCGVLMIAYAIGLHLGVRPSRWLEAGRVLFGLLVEAFVPQGGSLLVGIDETLERRYGEKISARGIYRYLRCIPPTRTS